MKFILRNYYTEEHQSVTRECVERVKGKASIDSLIKKVEQTGKPVETHFENEYDLVVAN